MNVTSSLFSSVANKPFWPEHRCANELFVTREIRVAHPGGADVIVVMEATQPGWSLIPNQSGIIAILIGLLLPAVQKVRAGDGSVIPVSLLKPRGKLGVNDGPTCTYDKIEWVWG